jgi:hypothetical protein
MKYLLFPLCLLLNVGYLHAKKEVELSYPVSAIAPELKGNAHAVIREENIELNVVSLNKVKYKKGIAITILDAKGKDYAKLVCGYNTLQEINSITGKLFDQDGKLIREMKEKDAIDVSTFGSSFIFHTDSRIKKFDFNYYNYPFTVLYTIEQTINTTFFLPDWNVQPAMDCSVEKASYSLTYPGNIPVRYKEYLMPSDLVRSEAKENDKNIFVWNLKNIPAKYEQPMSKFENYEGPTLVLSASRFDLLKHTGNMDSWKELGLFMYTLNNGLDVLPDEKKAAVKSLTAGTSDTYEKVSKLYKYMQESTRYVAIEYGIAGWQTFDALDVAKNGYGDCKGLTNYLKALLKEAGIKSYATLVFAGSEDYFKLDESFPSNVFNHVILCVPDVKDTIWVECTSQQLAAGYLGDFTQDRKVLLITENGGVICQTPSYNLSKSFISRKATLSLSPASNAQRIDLENHYGGLMQDDLSFYTKTQPENKINELVSRKFPFASYSVDHYKYKQTGNYSLPELEETVRVSVSGLITKTQKRTFLSLGWMSNPMVNIDQAKARTVPLVLNKSFKIVDTVIVNLPEGIEIESMPDPVKLMFDFGSYNTTFERSNGQVIFIRNYIQNKGIFKTEDYYNYQKMYNAINEGKSNLNLVFLNKAS